MGKGKGGVQGIPPQMDAGKLTLDEWEQVETMAKASLKTLNDDDKPSARLVRGLVVVVKRRTDPSFTWADAGSLGQDEAGRVLAALNADGDVNGGDGPGPT